MERPLALETAESHLITGSRWSELSIGPKRASLLKDLTGVLQIYATWGKGHSICFSHAYAWNRLANYSTSSECDAKL